MNSFRLMTASTCSMGVGFVGLIDQGRENDRVYRDQGRDNDIEIMIGFIETRVERT